LKYIDNYFENVLISKQSPNKLVLNHIESALGIKFIIEDINDDIKQLINKRAVARIEKNWEESDSIRDKLNQLGINVRDEAENQIWVRL
jgi:cysteinyl-tRNA synthetase